MTTGVAAGGFSGTATATATDPGSESADATTWSDAADAGPSRGNFARIPDSGICAELEIFHSRLVAPTRRVALGQMSLPRIFGPVLLGCVAGWFSLGEDDDFFADSVKLLVSASQGKYVPQPHLRHRFQRDKVGLLRSAHRLCFKPLNGSSRSQGSWSFESDEQSSSGAQHVLGVLYALYELPEDIKRESGILIEQALQWSASQPSDLQSGAMPMKEDLLEFLATDTNWVEGAAVFREGSFSGGSFRHTGNNTDSRAGSGPNRGAGDSSTGGRSGGRAGSRAGARNAKNKNQAQSETHDKIKNRAHDAVRRPWALNVLEFEVETSSEITVEDIQVRFRKLLRQAHPDSGGNAQYAATRISDLSEARRILIG